jgi:D-alanyl-D-alanine carboxypeptidase
MQPNRPTKGDQPKNALQSMIRVRLLACVVAASLCVFSRPTGAQASTQLPSDHFSSIVIDAATGQVLSSVNPDAERYPASLTKMMTLYLAFEALRDHRITDDERVPVSPHAASQAPSKLGLVPGSNITVRQAMLALVTKSANDAACALGELMGGSEEHFAQMMTLRAHALGMTRTSFRNASGLPDSGQVTTAADLALLARHLVRDFPDQYRLFSTPSFVWRGQMIANHDHLLKSYPGADGMKTGYTDAAGHNLVTSAVNGNVRLIGVILGAPSNPARDSRMVAILNDGYAKLNIAPSAVHEPTVAIAANTTKPRHHFPHLIASAEAASLPASPPRHTRSGGANWTIQLGSFTNQSNAAHAANQAARKIDGDPRIERVSVRGHVIYRAKINGLHQNDATAYCHRHSGCAIIPPLNRVASR